MCRDKVVMITCCYIPVHIKKRGHNHKASKIYACNMVLYWLVGSGIIAIFKP